MRRLHLSAGVLLVYWLMLVGGLALFTFNRLEDAHALQGLWLGMLTGTGIGHFLAIRDVRWGGSFVIILLAACWFVAIIPPDVAGSLFAKVFVAAGLCAYWSLGDRGSLAAFWFPTMIWMLTILDRTGAASLPDRTGVILLGALALMFVVFLRARETRRIQLWRTVAFQPLARPKAATILKEHPGGQIARASWMLLVGAGAFALTAWLAPKLWQTEMSDGAPVIFEGPQHAGLPCCPTEQTETKRLRVKEYLDVGLGHDVADPDQHRPGIDCQICDGSSEYASGYGGGYTTPTQNYVPSGGIEVTGTVPQGTYYDTPGWIRTVDASGTTTWTRTGDTAPAPGGGTTYPSQGGSYDSSQAGGPPPPVAGTTYTTPGTYTPSTGYSPSTAYTPSTTYTPSAPSVVPPTPPPAATPPVANTPPPAPTPPVASAPSAPSSTIANHEPATTIAPSHPSDGLGGGILRWLLVLVCSAFALQLVALVLRPLRRMVTLRHLRRPYWTETVDQRISNSWQLALIGLRDAGWRASSSEAPREFAARVNVEGLERCATILERARHGLGVDADDLAEMSASADAAYASARASLGTVARAGAAVRWPLT